MAMERISSPPFLDETAQSMLLALQGIRSAVQPANVYLDLDITLAVSGWSSAAPYTYNWTSDKINESCSVKVSFLDGAEDTNPLYLEYEKTAGGIQFVAPVKPTAAIPVRIHIIYADANAITDVDDEMVSSSAISGAANVKEALQNVDNRLNTTEQDLTNLNISAISSSTTIASLCDSCPAGQHRFYFVADSNTLTDYPSTTRMYRILLSIHKIDGGNNRADIEIIAKTGSDIPQEFVGVYENGTLYWSQLALKKDIGNYKYYTANLSVPTGENTTVKSITLPKGNWIICSTLLYQSTSGVGARSLSYYYDSTSYTLVNTPALQGEWITVTGDRVLSSNSEFTFEVRAYQTSGANVTVNATITAVQIG